MASTQNHYQGSKVLTAVDPSQGTKVSQVTLPCDSRGAIDFSSYPFRVSKFDVYFLALITIYLKNLWYVHFYDIFTFHFFLQLFAGDLRDKMTSISIYGTVTDIKTTNNQESIFLLRIQDPTGEIWANLHFLKSWYYYYYIFISLIFPIKKTYSLLSVPCLLLGH